jgi:hypothetical protein
MGCGLVCGYFVGKRGFNHSGVPFGVVAVEVWPSFTHSFALFFHGVTHMVRRFLSSGMGGFYPSSTGPTISCFKARKNNICRMAGPERHMV